MATIINPDGTKPIAVKGWSRVPIAAVFASTPVQIITTGAHGFGNDTAGIEGLAINSALNGLWQISVTSATGFSLNGSTNAGIASGTTSGYAIDYSILPLPTVPQDGDSRNATSIASAIQPIANTIPYFYKRAGALALIGEYQVEVPDVSWGGGGPHAWFAGTQPATQAWFDIYGLTYLSLPAPYPVLQKGDVLVMSFTTSTLTTGGTVPVPLALGIALSPNNGTLNAATYLVGSAIAFPATFNGPMGLLATYTAQAADANKRYDVSIMLFGNIASPNTYAFKGDRQLLVQHYRPNA